MIESITFAPSNNPSRGDVAPRAVAQRLDRCLGLVGQRRRHLHLDRDEQVTLAAGALDARPCRSRGTYGRWACRPGS